MTKEELGQMTDLEEALYELMEERFLNYHGVSIKALRWIITKGSLGAVFKHATTIFEEETEVALRRLAIKKMSQERYERIIRTALLETLH